MPSKKNSLKKAVEKERQNSFSAKGKKFSAEDIEAVAEDATKLGYDPHEIAEKVLQFGLMLTGIPLYDYQKETAYRIIYSIVALEGETITMLFSRQSGKSEVLAVVIDTLCVILPSLAKILPDLGQFKDGFRVGLFAPQSDQVVTTYSRALVRLESETAESILSDPDIATELLYDAKLVLSNGSSLVGQTASKQSKIESKTYDFVIIEECQDMDSFMIEKSIEPMVTATFGTLVKCGTTGVVKNDFYYEIQRNQKRDRKVKDRRLRYHFEFNYKQVIKQKNAKFAEDGNRFHLNYGRFIEKQIDKRGKDSESFRLSFALIWALDSGMFLTDKEFAFITNRKKSRQYNVDDDWDVRAGLDIAKDDASTVLTIVRVEEGDPFKPPKKTVLNWIELHGVNYESQHEIILQALLEYNIKILYGDYTGVGKPVIDRLMYACGTYVYIVPYTFSRPSKSVMWQALRADIEAKRLTVPAHPNVRESEEYQNFDTQMKGLLKYYDNGNLVAEASDESVYDDYADSLGLAILAGNEEIEQTLEVEEHGSNPFLNTAGGVMDTITKNSW